MTATYVEPVTEEEYRARAGAMANMLTAAPYRHKQQHWAFPEEENPCGTTCCVAGWATLAAKGIVTIAADGGMTYDPDALAPIETDSDTRIPFWEDEFLDRKDVPTLWRWQFNGEAPRTGRAWLGLGSEAAAILFELTARDSVTHQEAVAIEILRRLADGRLPLDFTTQDVDVRALDQEIDARRARELNATPEG
jgi:hypothetical protein